ncbi:MAG: hypothetical protein GF331_08340, partial [Chitinivibrionales bacterium]|nr:hypothetical protein [Chitinivibrionales bacterium]
ALGELVRQHALIPWGRGYRVPVVATPQRASAILAIGCGTTECLRLVTERTVESVSTLERECANRHLALRTAPVYFDQDGTQYGEEVHRLVTDGAAARGILGCVFFAAALSTQTSEDTLSMLVRGGAPVAVIDEASAAQLAPRPAAHRTCVFAPAYGVTCGQAIGRLLAQLGHRHVAFITAYPDQDWARRRYEGLDRALRPTGDGEPVRFVTVVRHTERAYLDVLDPAKSIRDSSELLEAMHTYRPLARGLTWPEQQMDILVASYAPWKHNWAILDQLLADSRITAWVADNDPTALACQSFLERRGVGVPERLSLAGFDDGNFALVNNLTSYNFNCRAVMIAALHHILAPPPGRPDRPGPSRIEIEGYIAQRRTTGPAPQRA